MASREPHADLELALGLADLAHQMALPRFRASDLRVETKPDGSPVTDADAAIEERLRAELASARPGDSILGEERGLTGEGERRWYLDPIDGTKGFVAGDLDWYTLIALTDAAGIVLGVASGPALEERWWAIRGGGALRNGARIHVSECPELAQAVVGEWEEADGSLALLAAHATRTRPHPGHAHLAVASGEIDVFVGMSGKTWDFAPMQVIVEEAGGRFTGLDGRPSFSSGNALVSNGRVHDEALHLLRAGPAGSGPAAD